ncbi:MAG: rRNA maturation RNase YbeY [Chloroflexi bacterium]|nr:rRNA maturation RNase YbeY [Chloroflexota bacterium]
MAKKPIKSRAIVHTQIGTRYATLVKPDLLKKAARATLDQQRVNERVELTLVITGNVQLRALNRQFRHIDAPTDVLSFNGDEDDHYLGDVIISYPKAKEQATAGGHPIEAELQLLVVHGVLHLLGHDHYTPVEKAQMWQAQAAVLRSIRAAITGPVE